MFYKMTLLSLPQGSGYDSRHRIKGLLEPSNHFLELLLGNKGIVNMRNNFLQLVRRLRRRVLSPLVLVGIQMFSYRHVNCF